MINEIIDAIAKQLGDRFKPPEYHYYIEDTDQGLVEPCFIIKRVSSSQRERLGPQVLLDETYSIVFLCANDIRKLQEITEFISLDLRFIQIPGDRPIMTHNRRAILTSDDASVITFELTRTIWYKHEEPLQEKLIHKLGVK